MTHLPLLADRGAEERVGLPRDGELEQALERRLGRQWGGGERTVKGQSKAVSGR